MARVHRWKQQSKRKAMKKQGIKESQRTLFFNIGLAMALLMVTVAFEWKSYDSIVVEGWVMETGEPDALMPAIVTTQPPPPPPPKMVSVEIKEVKKETRHEEDMLPKKEDTPMPTDAGANDEIDIITDLPPTPTYQEEPADVVYLISEVKPAPAGGYDAFYGFLRNNLRYPEQARRMGVEGTVYVEFVVDKDGALTELKVLRGIGSGCDEEALRILKNAPAWKPGLQRGRPVKVRMSLPISFKLG